MPRLGSINLEPVGAQKNNSHNILYKTFQLTGPSAGIIVRRSVISLIIYLFFLFYFIFFLFFFFPLLSTIGYTFRKKYFCSKVCFLFRGAESTIVQAFFLRQNLTTNIYLFFFFYQSIVCLWRDTLKTI